MTKHSSGTGYAFPWEYPRSGACFRVDPRATDARATDVLVTTREPFDMRIDWRELLTYGMKDVCGPTPIRKHTRTGGPRRRRARGD